MKCFLMGSILSETEAVENGEYVILSEQDEWTEDAKLLGMMIDIDSINMAGHFSKVEVQNDYLFGQVSVPRVLDLLGKRHEIYFAMNEKGIIFVNEEMYVSRLIERIQCKKRGQASSKEQFLYNFITQIFKNDIQILEEYERRIIELEAAVMADNLKDFNKKLVPIRRELLVLKGYYEQAAEMGKELEENENAYFNKKRLKYFRSITDKAERLESKSEQLLAYSGQVRDMYQSAFDAKQNKAIEFLTIVSTIFLPLTLLTSWYGMNFKNMPELETGYPALVAAAVIIVIVTIVIFKKKGIIRKNS